MTIYHKPLNQWFDNPKDQIVLFDNELLIL